MSNKDKESCSLLFTLPGPDYAERPLRQYRLYDIVDSQQRLTTLIILSEMHRDGS
jgi:uncharacterized protein with ParB-like and HNH nuclease domain